MNKFSKLWVNNTFTRGITYMILPVKADNAWLTECNVNHTLGWTHYMTYIYIRHHDKINGLNITYKIHLTAMLRTY